jgi:hypothetical protein
VISLISFLLPLLRVQLHFSFSWDWKVGLWLVKTELYPYDAGSVFFGARYFLSDLFASIKDYDDDDDDDDARERAYCVQI